MGHIMKDNMKKAKSMVKVSSFLQMGLTMTETLIIMIFMEEA